MRKYTIQDIQELSKKSAEEHAKYVEGGLVVPVYAVIGVNEKTGRIGEFAHPHISSIMGSKLLKNEE